MSNPKPFTFNDPDMHERIVAAAEKAANSIAFEFEGSDPGIAAAARLVALHVAALASSEATLYGPKGEERLPAEMATRCLIIASEIYMRTRVVHASPDGDD